MLFDLLDMIPNQYLDLAIYICYGLIGFSLGLLINNLISDDKK